ncbi:MAG TPA: archease [Thermoplasmata archaeon]|nr:archease [Thermoplasmata archaeon]
MRYRLLEHTADAMVEVHGVTLEERFENAAYALFDQITDASTVRPKGEVEVSVSAGSREQLLVDFLQELLFLHDTENLVFSRFVVEMEGDTLRARAQGEEFDPTRHAKRSVVKGITYHGLEFRDDESKLVLLFDV